MHRLIQPLIFAVGLRRDAAAAHSGQQLAHLRTAIRLLTPDQAGVIAVMSIGAALRQLIQRRNGTIAGAGDAGNDLLRLILDGAGTEASHLRRRNPLAAHVVGLSRAAGAVGTGVEGDPEIPVQVQRPQLRQREAQRLQLRLSVHPLLQRQIGVAGILRPKQLCHARRLQLHMAIIQNFGQIQRERAIHKQLAVVVAPDGKIVVDQRIAAIAPAVDPCDARPMLDHILQ